MQDTFPQIRWSPSTRVSTTLTDEHIGELQAEFCSALDVASPWPVADLPALTPASLPQPILTPPITPQRLYTWHTEAILGGLAYVVSPIPLHILPP